MAVNYSSTHKTVRYSKYNGEGSDPLFTDYEESLYCGKAIHPFVMTMIAFKTERITMQEAFTSLLLQSQEFKIHPHQLQTIIDGMFGEGSAEKVLEEYAGGIAKTIKSGLDEEKIITHGDIGLGFAVSTSEEK